MAVAPAGQARKPDPRYVLRYGNVRDGRVYGRLPASAASGSGGMFGDGSGSAVVDGDRAAALWRSMPAAKTLIVLEWDDGDNRRVIDQGIVWTNPTSEQAVTLGWGGPLSLLNSRDLIPNTTADLIAAGSLTWSNADHGTIMRNIVEQVQSMPAGDLPFVLQAARSGTRTRTYDGFDVATAGQRITELSQVEPNTEFLFRPRYASPDDTTHVVWDFLTGTEANPRLTNTLPWRLNRTAPGQTVVGEISIDGSADELATHAYAVGGGEEKAKVIRGASDSTLTDAGWPRMDRNATNDATDATTVQGYADGLLARSKRPSRGVKVAVDAGWWWGQDRRVGDWVHLTADHRIVGRLDFTSRVTEVGWDITSRWVQVTLADALAEDGF